MIDISAEIDVIGFMLGSSFPLEKSPVLRLLQATPISKLIIVVRWREEDLLGVFSMVIVYYNQAGESIEIPYAADIHGQREIKLIDDRYPDFICTHMKFYYPGTTADPRVFFDIKAFKFEDKTEKST